MKYEPWSFVDKQGAPDWLQSRNQGRGTVYRIYYVRLGYNIRKVIKGNFENWKDAEKVGDSLLTQLKKKSKEKPGIAGKVTSEILCSDLVDEILNDKDANGLTDSTYDQAEIFYRKHILPFLGGNYERDSIKGVEKVYTDGVCPLAKDLTPQIWKAYKKAFREKNKTSPLFNHWKFFVTLFKYAYQNRILEKAVKLEYSEKREDNREAGLVISDQDVQKMIFRAATKNWKNRIILQWGTGGRPGEIRNLRTKPIKCPYRKLRGPAIWPPNVFIQGDKILIRYYEFDTKNKQEREFYLKSDLLKNAILEQMLRYPDSPYLFPNERNNSKPMDKCLNGWYSTLERAGIDPNFTPHDLRHTYLTKMFKKSNEWAVICFQAGLSLEEAQKTYLHMSANDTWNIAHLVATMLTPKQEALCEVT
jgi:integrase